MSLIQKISLFVFILLLTWLTLLIWQVGLILIGILALYYFIFVHTIKDKKNRTRIWFISLYAVCGLMLLAWAIFRWKTLYENRQYDQEIKEQSKMNQEIEDKIKKINSETKDLLLQQNTKNIPGFENRYTDETVVGLNVRSEMYPKFYHWFDTEWHYDRLKSVSDFVLPIIMNWLCQYQDLVNKYFNGDLSNVDKYDDTQVKLGNYYYLYNIVAQILKVQLTFIDWETPLFKDPLMVTTNDPLYKYNIYMALSNDAYELYESMWINSNDLPIKPYKHDYNLNIDWIWYDQYLCSNYKK